MSSIEVKSQIDLLQTRRDRRVELKKKSIVKLNSAKDDVEKKQIKELLYKLPKLDTIFEVHRKIGEGTFSSVYLGSLRQHASLPDSQKRWFAIKHLVPTAHPARIEHELRCMQEMGGKHNVIGVELCLRHFDTIVFIMPYIPHRMFSEYVGEMGGEELRQYMAALLAALRHVHSHGVIHRDVKPSNFLYDRENRRYQLVDFGLAQRLCPPPAHASSHKRPRDQEEECGQESKRLALDLSAGAGGPTAAPPPPAPVPPTPNAAPKLVAKPWCSCVGAGGVCGWCGSRPAARAPRAGTQGFRPPEVLLKCPGQTTAVDVWAAGVMLASVLCARYPLLRAPDDLAALAELADLLGTAAIARAARALGRRVVTSAARPGLCLRKLSARSRGLPSPAHPRPAHPAPPPSPAPPCARCTLAADLCLCPDPNKPPWQFEPAARVGPFPDSAFALAARLLEPDPRTRLTAEQALRHPYLAAGPHSPGSTA